MLQKNSPGNAGDARDVCLIPGWGRSPRVGNGTPLQFSCLENSMDRGGWWATVFWVTRSQTWLSVHTQTHTYTYGRFSLIYIIPAAAAAAKSLQSCPTLCDPVDSSPPGSPIPGMLQAWTGVGWHFLLQCKKVKSESEVAQSCPTLHDPMDCSLQGSSTHEIFQARVVEWGAVAFSDIIPSSLYMSIPISQFIPPPAEIF